MNIAVPTPNFETRPRTFTVDDVRRMIEAGILHEDERVELVDGELVEMASKSIVHDVVVTALTRLLVTATSPDIVVAVDATLQLSRLTLLEPDFLLFPKLARVASREGFATVAGADVLLAVVVSVSSLRYDRGRKAALYAAHGIPEYWVIDAGARTAFVHIGPKESGWERVTEVGAHDMLRPIAPALSGVAVRLADLE